MFKKLLHRYMEQAGTESAAGGANTNAPAGAAPAAAITDPAGTAPATGGEQAAALTPEQIAQAAADQTAADKVIADKTAADAAKAAEDAKKLEGAPEKYEFKLPEGHALDAGVQEQFEATARELNMTQDAAQKLVEVMAPKIAAAQAAAFEKVQTEWVATAKADPELGGDKFDANLAVAKKAMDRFGSPALKTYLNETGLGNNPEMLRMMLKAGQAISEDKHVQGNPGNASARDRAKSLYPTSN